MRLGEAKGKQLVNDIKAKMDNGVISLPQNLGAEDFAYAMEMYRAYGVESSLQKAYKATTKLSAEENAQIINDILDAGDTGLGVKKKAEQIRLSLHKGPLENDKSLYNKL